MLANKSFRGKVVVRIGAVVWLFAEVGTSANPQIADSRFYLWICGPNFLLQIFAVKN